MSNPKLKSKLDKSVDFLKSELTQIRAGRASPTLVEDVEVNIYNSKMTLKELGSITLQDSQTIIVSPWDKKILETIVSAIRDGKLNLNPTVIGDVVRIPLPPLTEERRIELTKLVSQRVEESKTSIRNIRQDVMKSVDKNISDDEQFAQRKEIEEVVKEYVAMVDEIGDAKKKGLLEV